MKPVILTDRPASPGTLVYVADLYRASPALGREDLEYLSLLPPFSVLFVKSIRSRTLDIFPPRPTPDLTLTEEGADFLARLGVTQVLADNHVLEDHTGKLTVTPGVDLTHVLPGFYWCEQDSSSVSLCDQVPLPIGVRRDGSLCTRIQWASTTEKTPYYWVNNLIDDDIERHGGTWGANTMGPANCILDFFGELKTISAIRLFHNVGSDESIIEEMASHIRMYVCDDERCGRFGRDTQDINTVSWELIADIEMRMEEHWRTVVLPTPVKGRYFRLELVKNFGTPPDVPWTETSELKIYPAAQLVPGILG